MKLKNAAVVAAALALAIGMTACGSSSSTASSAASSVAASSVASSAAASSEAASSEAAVEPAEYTVYNTTGTNVAELYLYAVGSEDKGENLAGEGLADGESVVLTLPEDADTSAKYVLEFTTDDGATQSFETLSYEVTPISLLSVDAAAGATPHCFRCTGEVISAAEPQIENPPEIGKAFVPNGTPPDFGGFCSTLGLSRASSP